MLRDLRGARSSGGIGYLISEQLPVPRRAAKGPPSR